MAKIAVSFLVAVVLVLGHAKDASTPAPEPNKTEVNTEIGVIMTVYAFNNPNAAQIRHIPFMPGYDNFSGSVPGIGFSNPDIHFLSVDVDYALKNIYLYDKHQRAIAIGTGYNKDLNISDMVFIYLNIGVSLGTVQVAVDWLSHMIYWTDAGFRWIVCAPGLVEKVDYDYYKIIADDHLDAPDGITLDPFDGWLFWSDNGRHPKIERSDMMGGNRETIISARGGLSSPRSLESDIFEKRIYWIDSSKESVMSANYRGGDIRTIQRLTHTSLVDLAVFRECVMVTDVRYKDLYTLNKTIGPHIGKYESTIINISPEAIYGIAVYHPENQPLNETDICVEKNCEQMCISTRIGALCECADGYKMNRTTGICDENLENIEAIYFANATHICMVDIRSFANFNFVPYCIFSVIEDPQDIPTPASARRKRRQAGDSPTTTIQPKSSSTIGPGPDNTSNNTTLSPTKATSTTTVPQTTTPTTTTTTTPAPTASPGDMITMFDIDMKNRILYFVSVDNTIYERVIDLPITNDVKLRILQTTPTISGIAYDAEDGNLYFCESDPGAVKLVNSVLGNSATVTENLTKPRKIIVLIKNRKLAWIAGDKDSCSIQTTNMQGDTVNTLLDNFAEIESLVVDEDAKLFYFLSTGSVYSLPLTGGDATVVIYSVEKNAYILLHYNNYMAWVYLLDGYAHVIKTEDFQRASVIAHGYFDMVSVIVDIKVLDKKLQSSEVHSPCAYENGGCSHICITKYVNNVMTKVCECKLGFTLDRDLKSCITVTIDDNFLLVADWTNDELQQIDLKTHEIHAIDIPASDGFMGVFFNPVSKKIIWSEFWNSEIYSAYLNGSDYNPVVDIGNAYVYRLDLDLTTFNMYYTAYYYQHIGMITPDGTNIWLDDDFFWEDLGDIVLHPGKGWMFYTVNDYPSYIARADMDGKNSVKLIQGDHVGYPDGLAIDFNSDKLYWSDATYDTIQACDLDAVNCTTIVNMTGTYRYEQIRDLVIDGAFLYYSAYKKDHVVRVDLQEPYERTIVGQSPELGMLDTMALFKSTNKNIQAVGEACKARNGLGDCSTICIPTPAGSYKKPGRTCACESGISLNDDARTCSNIHQCSDAFEQRVRLATGDEEDIPVTVDEACLRHEHDICMYTCPDNYISLNKRLQCTMDGWNNANIEFCIEFRCPVPVKNGALDKTCHRDVGEKCSYHCNPGFTNSTDSVVCTKDGTYHVSTDTLCKPFQCTETIEHGDLDPGCSRDVGTSCKYKCNKFYSFDKQNTRITCTNKGWQTNTAGLCRESICQDSSLSNGHVTACTKKIGEACVYECDKDHTNVTYKTVCRNDLVWHPQNACPKMKCPSAIVNGGISASCDTTIGKLCGFVCRPGYTPTDRSAAILCLTGGKWNQTDKLCIETLVVVAQQQTGGVPTGGAIAGFMVLIIVIVALVAVLVFFFRRNMTKSAPSNYSTGSFHNGGNIAIENPGYIQNRTHMDDDKNEHPYSSVDPSQMQPVTIEEGAVAADTGIQNPMYNNEPLPALAHVDVTNDAARLTYDSWLRDQKAEHKF